MRRPRRSAPRLLGNDVDAVAPQPDRRMAIAPTILAVEDEPAILELLRVNLVDAGYEVQAAADAETAQTMLKEALPDLVLLDWMLPGQSGLAFAKQIRADARTDRKSVV